MDVEAVINLPDGKKRKRAATDVDVDENRYVSRPSPFVDQFYGNGTPTFTLGHVLNSTTVESNTAAVNNLVELPCLNPGFTAINPMDGVNSQQEYSTESIVETDYSTEDYDSDATISDPDYVTSEVVLEAASRLHRKKVAPEFSDAHYGYNYVLGPLQQYGAQDLSQGRSLWQQDVPMGLKSPPPYAEHSPSPPPSEQEMLEEANAKSKIPRKMVKQQSSMIKRLFPGYPTPNEDYPEDFTLTELCARYPNHVSGDNLKPFIQHGWTQQRIIDCMPNQDAIPEDKRISRKAIEGRLHVVREKLRKAGLLAAFVSGPKTHREGSMAELEAMESDSDEEDQ